MPRVSVSGKKIEVFGKGAPLVYINNKRVVDNEEIQRLHPDDIKSISVITSPGAEYNAEMESVIRIRTMGHRNDGFSLRAVEMGKYNTWFTDLEQLTTSYQTEKLEVTNTIYTMTGRGDEDNFLVTDLQANDNKYRNTQHSLYNISDRPINEHIAVDYALNDINSIGASYRYYGTLRNRCHNRDNYDVYQNDHKSLYLQLNMSEKTHRPSYRQLRSFKQYDNRYLYEGGNPELQPEKVLSRPYLSCNLNHRLSITGTFGTTITFKGMTGGADGFLMYRPNYMVNLQIDKSFAKRQWVIYLTVNDIFKTSKERWTMYGISTESTKNCYYTRGLTLQVVYNLNARHSKYRGTGAGNEERGRL